MVQIAKVKSTVFTPKVKLNMPHLLQLAVGAITEMSVDLAVGVRVLLVEGVACNGPGARFVLDVYDGGDVGWGRGDGL